MRARLGWRWLWVVLSATLLFGAGAGCTLLTNFDPNGQPCDLTTSDPDLQCLSDAGYACVNGKCVLGAEQNPSDGGP